MSCPLVDSILFNSLISLPNALISSRLFPITPLKSVSFNFSIPILPDFAFVNLAKGLLYDSFSLRLET